MNGETIYIVTHQVLFLLTGLCTTLGTQWLFYHGAATGDSYLAQLAQYIGMVLVGLIIPILLKNKQKGYHRLSQQAEEDGLHMVQIDTDVDHTKGDSYEEGPIPHKSVIKLAVLDVFANFCVTVGFSIVGSGWVAIFGVSAGLAISSMDSFSANHSKTASLEESAKTTLLMFGTLMTLGGTFFYACVYVYSDSIMSQQKPPPLPARICFYSGCYTSVISLVWIAFYTLPRYDDLIHIKAGTSNEAVVGMWLLAFYKD
ncbi:hypothetical protein EDC94DRAFT_634208 [Helicostylum pulchrum]|nr:hypothetical protein EDC94DRAFT_634208 [Helicostylum pulchrum]